MADKTWTQTDGNLSSTAANWDGGVAPVAGDNIIFDGTSTANCTWDLATNSFGTFTIAAGYSGTITQSSDMYISGYSQAGGTFTGSTAKRVSCNGNFIKSSGTITSTTLNLIMTGNGYTLSGSIVYPRLTINGNTTFVNGYEAVFLNNNANITIASGQSIVLRYYSGGAYYYTNNGLITGGTLFVKIYDGDKTISFGVVESDIKIYSISTSTGNRKLTLLDGLNDVLAVSIYSEHATYTMTLDLNGHSPTASSITVGTRGILQCGEGTITTASLDSSAGTITEETATWITTGGGTIKTNGTDPIYNYIALGSDTLGANLVVSNEYVRFTEPKLAGFAITHNAPEKFYSGGKTKYTRGYVRGYLKTGKNRAINRFLEKNTR